MRGIIRKRLEGSRLTSFLLAHRRAVADDGRVARHSPEDAAMLRLLLVFAFLLLPTVCLAVRQQPPFKPNYDETKVPKYVLPELLGCADGSKVKDAKTWQEKRRPEILALYGRTSTARARGGRRT
jgi:hypothetical protein